MQLLATDTTASEPLLETDSGVFTVVRSGGDLSQSATVTYAIEGTAENGVDYETLSGTVVIPAGQTDATISIEAIDDTLIEGDETVKITLQNSDGYVIGAAQNMATATIIDSAPTIPEQTETFSAPEIERTSNTTWDMVMKGSDGSQMTTTIFFQGFELYVKQVQFAPSHSSGAKGYTANINPTGTKIDVPMDGDTNPTTFDGSDRENVNIILDDVLNVPPITIPIDPIDPIGPPSSAPTNRHEMCEVAEKMCEAVSIIGNTASGLATFSALTGVGVVAAGPLGAIAGVAKVAQYACIFFLGTSKDLANELANEILGFGFGKLGGKLIPKGSVPIRRKLAKELGNSVDRVDDRVIDALAGNSDDIAGNVFDLVSSLDGLQQQLANDSSDSSGVDGLAKIRKAFGVDFCDEPEVKASLNTSLDPITIGYGSSATLTVEFVNPNNNTTSINISGSGLRGLGNYSFAVPDEFKGGGTLEFSITNQGYAIGDGNCNNRENNFLNVSVDGAGFEQIKPYNLTGGVDSFVFACSAVITPLF